MYFFEIFLLAYKHHSRQVFWLAPFLPCTSVHSSAVKKANSTLCRALFLEKEVRLKREMNENLTEMIAPLHVFMKRFWNSVLPCSP